MSKKYKVTVYVMTPYSTIVEADTEEDAIKNALEREGPALLVHYDNVRDFEWTSEGVDEFPNLGINEQPEVEEI